MPRVIDISADAQVAVDVVATVYGEFQNQLAVKCARIDEGKAGCLVSLRCQPSRAPPEVVFANYEGGAIGGW